MVLDFIAENTRKALFWGAGILLALCILGYAYYEFHPFLLGPVISIESPINGSTVATPLVAVTGIAKNITDISLNGRPITIDERGRFSEKTAVPEGYAILTLSARDRFGRTTTQTLQLWRDKTGTVIASSSASSTLPIITSSSTPNNASSTSKKR